MSLRWYGRPIERARPKLARLVTSSDKNHSPSPPSGPLTYVRTLVSGNRVGPGTGTFPTTSHVVENGVNVTHAAPSKLSTSSGLGTSEAMASTGNGQCTKA